MNLLNTETELFSGQGYVFLAKRDPADGSPLTFRQVGNVDALTISNNTNKIEKREQMTGSRGVLATLITENTAAVSMDWSSWSPENLAIGMRSKVTKVPATAIPAPLIRTVTLGGLIGLEHLNPSAISVKSEDGATTYEAGADKNYQIDDAAAMVKINANQGTAAVALSDDEKVQIVYTPGAQSVVEAFTEAAENYWLRFKGLNTGNGNRPVLLDIYKMDADPLNELALINPAEYVNYTMAGTALYDDKRTSGSPYYTYKYLDAA